MTRLRSSLWRGPVASMAAAVLVARAVRWVDDQTRWTLFNFGLEGARTVLGALGSSLLTFIVFAFSILLLSVQMASGQLSPRVIARVFENRTTKLTIGAFVFTWIFSLAAVGRVEDRVPQLSVAIAILLSIVSVGLFFYLVQDASHALRPVTLLTGVANDTRAVIETVYPEPFSQDGGEHAALQFPPDQATRTINYRRRSGVVLALDVEGLVDIATRANCVIEILPMVGDFLATGEDVCRLHGDAVNAVDATMLRRHIALGSERTLTQDPIFGFRIIVDIAAKALSPAINDPTTAVLAIDQLHHLLHLLGQKQLDTGVFRDSTGRVRLVYRTPDWADFITLAATEIRLYAGLSPQVTRRLQAMFERLLESVPPQRAREIGEQMTMLRKTVERTYTDVQDREMAICADLQGFGSRSHTETATSSHGHRDGSGAGTRID
jgi:uncharacterized membrane protein